MSVRALAIAALVAAACVAVSGAVFAVAAGLSVATNTGTSLFPGMMLGMTVWMAQGRRLATVAALIGAVLVLALGVALYAAALSSDRPHAVLIATGIVPMRQIAAVAVVSWAVWLTRRA